MKRIASLTLVICLLVSLLTAMPAMPVAAAAIDGGSCGNSVTWELDGNGTLTISGIGNMANWTNQSVPWEDKNSIKKVVIHDGVTSIGESAFKDCTNLTSIDIGHGVSSIGYRAFINCTSLTNVTISDSVISIGQDAFTDCTGLMSVHIGKGVTSIGPYAFGGCINLANITVSDGITRIEGNAFFNTAYYNNQKNWLNDVLYIGNYYLIEAKEEIGPAYTVRNGTKCIANDAFAGCSKLSNITIPTSVSSIGNSAFIGTAYYNDKRNWSNGLLYIGNWLIEASSSELNPNCAIQNGTIGTADSVFSYCEDLLSVTIPDSLKFIGNDNFFECTSLTDVHIGSGVSSIKGNIFRFCESLTNITVDTNNENYSAIDGNLFDKKQTTLVQYAVGKPDAFYTIPNSVTSIEDCAFQECTSLVRITISDNVTNIGASAFSECDNLSEAHIGSGVRTIGDEAFCNCISLSNVTIPKGITSIGERVFCYCDSLTDVRIEDGVGYIGEYMFSWCENLTNVTIPDSVSLIGTSAFSDCYNLTNVNIPKSIVYIGNNAFKWCDNTTELRIPGNNTEIGKGAFSHCSNLRNVVLENGVNSLGQSAFSQCENLKSVSIPDSVISIGSGAFAYCNSLTEITVGSNNEKYTAIDNILFDKDQTVILQYAAGKQEPSYDIPDGVITIEECAFTDCENLESVRFPNSTAAIKEKAFSDCSNLSNIIFGNGLKEIGNNAFESCGHIANLIIPGSVTAIGVSAFASCPIDMLRIKSGVKEIGIWAFTGCGPSTVVVIPKTIKNIGRWAFGNGVTIKDVYYEGDETQWKTIGGLGYNNPLTSATIHYNYKELPYTISAIQKTGGGVNITVNQNVHESFPSSATVIVAAYANRSILQSMAQQPLDLSKGTQTLFIPIDLSDAKSVCAYVWEDTNTIRPLSEKKRQTL